MRVDKNLIHRAKVFMVGSNTIDKKEKEAYSKKINDNLNEYLKNNPGKLSYVPKPWPNYKKGDILDIYESISFEKNTPQADRSTCMKILRKVKNKDTRAEALKEYSNLEAKKLRCGCVQNFLKKENSMKTTLNESELLLESPHKDDIKLNKKNKKSKKNRKALADTLKLLRKNSDLDRKEGKDRSANFLRNISASISRVGSHDPKINKVLSVGGYDNLPDKEKYQVDTYVPTYAKIPSERIPDARKANKQESHRYFNDKDFDKIQHHLDASNGMVRIGKNVSNLLELKPNLAAGIRETNPTYHYRTVDIQDPTYYHQNREYVDPSKFRVNRSLQNV